MSHLRLSLRVDHPRSYVMKDGHLFLALMADVGIYEFEPLASAKPPARAT